MQFNARGTLSVPVNVRIFLGHPKIIIIIIIKEKINVAFSPK